MKNQALFSWKDKSKKLKCRLLHFLFGALWVKEPYDHFSYWHCPNYMNPINSYNTCQIANYDKSCSLLLS